jgi:hypothetical protein
VRPELSAEVFGQRKGGGGVTEVLQPADTFLSTLALYVGLNPFMLCGGRNTI